jgi:hypothetical protein
MWQRWYSNAGGLHVQQLTIQNNRMRAWQWARSRWA